MGLLAGTREDELVYMYNTAVCDKGGPLSYFSNCKLRHFKKEE